MDSCINGGAPFGCSGGSSIFGLYRTVLAILVVITHFALIPFLGSAAVMGFFILSGYLMTYIMGETYGYSRDGLGRFALNRLLRLFPSYWVSLIISVIVILFLGQNIVSDFRTPFGIPQDLGTWLANLTLLYPSILPQQVSPRIAPATWALTTELVYYALIGLGLSRSRWTTWLWFIAALGWHVFYLVAGLEQTWQYHFIGAGALPFSTGALIYHYRAKLAEIVERPLMVLACGGGLFAIATACVFYGIWANNAHFADLGFYLNLLAQGLMIIALANIDFPRFRKWDNIVGDWSYHIYILHWATGALWAIGVFGLSAPGRNFSSLIVVGLATVTAIGISLLLTRYVDRPVQKLRQRLKAGIAGRAAQP